MVEVTMKTYEVICSRCKGLRWPYLSEPPKPGGYVCSRCRGETARAARGTTTKRTTTRTTRTMG